MPIKRILSDCPQCGKAEGQIIGESLGHYTACHACGLTLAHHEKTPEIAAEKWNALASKLSGPTMRTPDAALRCSSCGHESYFWVCRICGHDDTPRR